jgi:SAM-dependent methyltransferase
MRAWADVEQVLHGIWTLDAGRDDEASVHAETARTVPLLIALVASPAAAVEDRGRAALLLGLIAEARGATAADCRAEIRKGTRTYLDGLVRNRKREGLVAALLYLLAHFPEDAGTILDALGARFDEANPAFAQLRRLFDPPSTLRRVGSVEELTASTLAEMGARAVSTLPLLSVTPGDVGEQSAPSSAAGLAQRLMEDRALVKLYESRLRPQFLRVMGGNWADHLSPGDEDAYIMQAPSPAPGPVLDLACGSGRWTRVVARKVGPERVIGLDLSGPMLAEAKALLRDVPLVRANALRLPFADGVLGGANCFNALQVLPDPEHVIRELGRCLRRDAVLTCFTFRRAPRGVYRYFQSRFERAAGVRAFRDDDIRGWLASAGMTATDFGGPNLCLFFTARKSV